MTKSYVYDTDNVLARVLRGELPSTRILDSAHTLIIRDIRPQAPDHLLALPKGPYVCFDHFMGLASADEKSDFFGTVQKVIADLDLSPDRGGGGYRLITNTGADGFQEIAHFHMHILGGRWLGPLLPGEADLATAEDVFGPKLTNADLVGKPDG